MAKSEEKKTREFALAAARVADDMNCSDVAVLDLKGISPATDYYVIATGTSNRQIRSVADQISETGNDSIAKFII